MSFPAGERNRRARWEGASEGNCANAALLSVLDVPLAAAISLDRAAWLIALRMPLGLLQLSQLVGREQRRSISRSSLPLGETDQPSHRYGSASAKRQ